MFVNGVDYSAAVILVCIAIQILAYLAFFVWAIRQPDPEKARRWKASILFVGLAFPLVVIAMCALMGIQAASQRSEINLPNSPSGVILLIRRNIEGLAVLACIALPVIFFSILSTYMRFVQTGDYWLDWFWRKMKW